MVTFYLILHIVKFLIIKDFTLQNQILKIIEVATQHIFYSWYHTNKIKLKEITNHPGKNYIQAGKSNRNLKNLLKTTAESSSVIQSNWKKGKLEKYGNPAVLSKW